VGIIKTTSLGEPDQPAPPPPHVDSPDSTDETIFALKELKLALPLQKLVFFIVFLFTSLRRSVGSTIAREKARTRTGAWAHSHAPVRRLTFSGRAVISAP